MKFLAGKKTYVSGALVVLAAIAYYMDILSAKEWEAILTALGGTTAMALRAALSKQGS